MHVYKNASVCMQVCMYVSIQVWKYENIQVCMLTSMHICKYARIHVCIAWLIYWKVSISYKTFLKDFYTTNVEEWIRSR